MAERQNTGNAVPSNDLKDLNDNTIIIDEFVNSEETETTDRLGNTIKTRVGILADLQERVDQIDNTKFVPLDGSKSADKLSLTDGDSTLDLTANSGELLVGDKQALLAAIVNAVKTISDDVNHTGKFQVKGNNIAVVITDSYVSADLKQGAMWLSNGLVMQWGKFSQGTGAYGYGVATLLAEMLDTQYISIISPNVDVTGLYTSTSAVQWQGLMRLASTGYNQTTTTFTVSTMDNFTWLVFGYYKR